MPSLHKLRIRKRQLGKTPTTGFVQFRLHAELLADFLDLKRRFKKVLNRTLTKSYIFREGGRVFLRQLRVQLELAENGQLHAKQRKPNTRKRQYMLPDRS